MTNYKPQFHFGTTERQTNGQVFATYDEAQSSALNRFRQWIIPTDYSVIETDDPVNYMWDGRTDVLLSDKRGETE
jgi:hypothetical protein